MGGAWPGVFTYISKIYILYFIYDGIAVTCSWFQTLKFDIIHIFLDKFGEGRTGKWRCTDGVWGGEGGLWLNLHLSGIVPKTVYLLSNSCDRIRTVHLLYFTLVYFTCRCFEYDFCCELGYWVISVEYWIATCGLCLRRANSVCLVHVNYFCFMYWVYTVRTPLFCYFLLEIGGRIIIPKHSPGLKKGESGGPPPEYF